MDIQIINHKSKWLNKVQDLGDTASGTVGFLPRDAYFDYARRNQILAVIDNDELLAYTMFRFRKSGIVIVHLCVADQYRGRGIPAKMIDWLLEQNGDQISHIQLACRRDYNLEKFWQKLGFSPVAEKAGRATKEHTILTIWVRDNPNCKDLFASLAGADTSKALVVLDTNIVIDLCEESNAESNLLLQTYLGTYAEFRITKFVLNEINQNDNETVRNRHRNYSKEHFSMLDNVDEEIFNRIKDDLLVKRSAPENSNTWFDIVHIAQAAAAGAEVFITRDEGWLNNNLSEYIAQFYGIRILSPGEFINSIDELNYPFDYAPLKLSGLGLEYSKMQSADFSATVAAFFQQSGMKKTEFEKKLRQWIGLSNRYTVLLVKTKKDPACLAVWELQNGSFNVEILLINSNTIKTSLQRTFIKRVAFKLLDDAHKAGMQEIKIDKMCLTEETCSCLRDCGFFDNATHLVRIIRKQIIQAKELDVIAALPDSSPLNLAIRQFSADQLIGNLTAKQVVSLEKAMWPMKFSDTDVPCFIVPIQADYAVQLFDENLCNQEVTLFENEKSEPALSIENTYFKTARNSVPKAPARILWYVSSSHYIGTPAIRACSYLDRVEKGSAKEMYEKYKRLGVLEWKELQQRAKGRDVATYVFSYTELFDHPVGLEEARKLINKPTETFQSFCTISETTFLNVYQAGM